IREAVVMIDGGLLPSTTLEAAADVFSIVTPDERARAEANTATRSTVLLSLDVNALVFTVADNRRLKNLLTVTNNDAFTRFGVALKARFPQDISQLFESDPEFTGDCLGTTCTFGEVISWPLTDLPGGQSFSVILPPTVAAPFVEGRLINFYAWVEDDLGVQARGAESIYSGCFAVLDNDCDGIRDSSDNCLAVANTSQIDTNGDGIGNACDPDVVGQFGDPGSNNCLVDFFDVSAFKAAFLTIPGDGNWNPDADMDDDDFIGFLDVAVLKAFFLAPPGPAASPNAASGCVP
ncbi:MAG: hypothetical protein OEQ74_10550, partial [Gammaproteobacteria bacterium]|nr:hypothetical protein [Gammaproteobacteria bacterium]